MDIRNILIAGAAFAAASIAGAAAAAPGTVSATAPASVTVVSAAVTLTKTQDMKFGTIVLPTTGSNTIILDANDKVTKSGGGDALIVASTTASAKFNLFAASGTTYTTTQVLAFDQPGLNNVSASAPVASSGTINVISSGSTQELRVGGQFDISPNTPAQAYTGTLTLTVNYQ
jgi:hypothetical protein